MDKIDPGKLKTKAEEAARLLKSMGHPSRLMVLCHLAKGESPVSALNQAVPLSQSALSQHLAGLRKAGLVDTRRDGKVIHYRLRSRAVSGVIETLFRIYCNPNEEEYRE